MFLSFLEVFGRDQQVREIEPRLIVVRIQFERTSQLLIGACFLSQTQKSECQMIVRLGKARVHLYGVAVLDRSLAVLCLFEIALAALEILLLAHVGVAGTTGPKAGKHREQKDQTE